jgi:2-hydroxychromene-2-carboxylate isomerase
MSLMSKQVDFYYDFGSPTAYLAWTQLPTLCAKYGAQLNYEPILLGGVFKAVGSTTPVAIKPKGEWMFDDMARFAARYGVPFTKNSHFIINTLPIMRGAVWAKQQGTIEPYNKAMFEAVWADGRDMADPDKIKAVVADAGLDVAAMAEAIQLPEIKQGLIASTEASVGRGIFGAPTMFVDGEMHFGQDRLNWVEAALRR